MEVNVPSLTLLSRKRSGGEKSQPNNREQGQGPFHFSSGARVRAVLCLHVGLSFVGVPRPVVGEASDSSAVKKRTCHMAAVHSGRSETAVTCSSFCPLYMCSSSRRWMRLVNTGGFDPGRLGDGGKTSGST